MSPQERRSLTLSPAEWAQLETLASQLNAEVTRGPTTGDTSWRALVRLIAQGQLTLTAIDPALPVENAAPNANNQFNQQSPQAETPGN